MPTAGDWKRLGELLEQRRGYLGFPVLERFLEHHGTDSKSSQARIITALENAERTNFRPATLANIERLYEWREGSIKRVLSGGHPMVTEVRLDDQMPPRAERPAAAKRWELVEMIGQLPDGDLDGVRRYIAKKLPETK